MSNTSLVIILGVLAALLLGGVLEVRVHPERLASVPSRIAQLASDKKVGERVRVQAVRMVRAGERIFLRDDQHQTHIALQHVKDDASRLGQLLEEHQDNPDLLLPQSQLLEESLEKVAGRVEATSIDDVAALKDESREALTQAQDVIRRLKEVQSGYAELQDRFARITETLEKSLGALGLGEEKPEGDVAGTSTQEQDATPIPLRF